MRLLVTTFLILASVCVQAQQLTLEQLTYLTTRDVDQINEYLSARGWLFDDAKTDEEGDARASWAFGKTTSYYDADNAKATSWLQVHNPGDDQTITYQASRKEHYDACRAKISAFNMTRVGSEVVDGGIRTTFVGARFVVSTSVRTIEGSSRPAYFINIQSKAAFLRSIAEPSDSMPTEQDEIETEDQSRGTR